VKEVKVGFDCGVAIEGFSDYKEGDTVEFMSKSE
jgi:translation initiation factor IF-2